MLSEPLGLPFRTSSSWQSISSKYGEYAGCDGRGVDTADCMRNQVTSDQLLSAQQSAQSDPTSFCRVALIDCSFVYAFLPWTPTFETEALPQTQPLQAFLDGEYNRNVPIMIGTVRDEGAMFVYDLVASMNGGDYARGLCRREYVLLLYAIVGMEDGDKIIAEYDSQFEHEEDCDYRALLSKIVTDFWFRCASRNSSESMSRHQDNVWKYQYNYLYVFTPPERYFGDNVFCQGRDGNVCHSDEVPLVFQPETLQFEERDLALSRVVQSYFTNLARDGQPGLEWTEYALPDEWSMVFTESGSHEMEMRFEENHGSRCDFWDELGYPTLWYHGGASFHLSDVLQDALFSIQSEAQSLADSKNIDECNRDCAASPTSEPFHADTPSQTTDGSAVGMMGDTEAHFDGLHGFGVNTIILALILVTILSFIYIYHQRTSPFAIKSIHNIDI